MDSSAGSERTLHQFALVSYLPEPLAGFLDQLRRDLTPGCNPRAHVTVLPPRPLEADIDSSIACLKQECRAFPAFSIRLGEICVFPLSNVIYASLAGGEHEIHALHENLNCGQLEYDGPFPYHPHITIAQNIPPDQVAALSRLAAERWATYRGPREFPVEQLSFVRNVARDIWLDLARIDLCCPVPASR